MCRVILRGKYGTCSANTTLQGLKVCKFCCWAEQAGEKLGGQGAPVPTVLLPRFSVWVVRTTSTPAVRNIVPKFMVAGGLRLKRGRRKGERDLVLGVNSGHTQSK